MGRVGKEEIFEAFFAEWRTHSREEVLGRTRRASVVLARHMLIYLLRYDGAMAQGGPYTNCAVGRTFGLDHTSVLHAVRKIKTLLESGSSPSVAAQIERIRCHYC
jgi:chromosomal replication initiation ATPase DnaA